jgi:hypothetical protein
MARDDLFIIAAVGIPIIAYVGNIGGFKTWADSAFSGGQAVGPNLFQQPVKTPKGTTITPQKAEADILGSLLNPSTKYGYGGAYPLGQIYDAVSKDGRPTKCWRNYPCGSRTPVAICKLTSADAINTWKNLYACKAKQAVLNPTENRMSIA